MLFLGAGGLAAEEPVIFTGHSHKHCAKRSSCWNNRRYATDGPWRRAHAAVPAIDDSDDDVFSDADDEVHFDEIHNGSSWAQQHHVSHAGDAAIAAGNDQGDEGYGEDLHFPSSSDAGPSTTPSPPSSNPHTPAAAAAGGQQQAGRDTSTAAEHIFSFGVVAIMGTEGSDEPDPLAVDAVGEAVLAALEQQLGLEHQGSTASSGSEAAADVVLEGSSISSTAQHASTVAPVTGLSHGRGRTLTTTPSSHYDLDLGTLVQQAMERHMQQVQERAAARSLAEWRQVTLTPQPSALPTPTHQHTAPVNKAFIALPLLSSTPSSMHNDTATAAAPTHPPASPFAAAAASAAPHDMETVAGTSTSGLAGVATRAMGALTTILHRTLVHGTARARVMAPFEGLEARVHTAGEHEEVEDEDGFVVV